MSSTMPWSRWEEEQDPPRGRSDRTGLPGGAEEDTASIVGGGLPARANIVIVGAGLAGLELAKALTQLGADDVWVLEAGPASHTVHVNAAFDPEVALRKWLQPATDPYFAQPWRSDTPPHYTGSSGLRRRLGGRSLYWYGVTLPIEPWALADWPEAVVRDLCDSWQDGPSLYRRMSEALREWITDASPTGSELLDNEVTVGPYTLSPTPKATQASSQRPGRWFAYSPLDHWRDPESCATRSPWRGIHVRTGVEVIGVTLNAGRASGVLVRSHDSGETSQISADATVLCAGTLENSRLAMQALHEVGSLPDGRLPHLADHIVQGFFLRLASVEARRVREQIPPGSYYTSGPEGRRFNLFLEVTESAEDGLLIDVRATGEQQHSPANYLSVTPTERHPWRLTVHAATTSMDLSLIEQQRAALQEVWNALQGTAQCDEATLDFGDFNNPERTNAFVLPETISTTPAGIPMSWSSFLGVEDHEGGTLSLGRVLTEDHEFTAVPGLYAAGPSTFPRLGAANPSLTTLALSHRLSGVLRERGVVSRSNAAEYGSGQAG